ALMLVSSSVQAQTAVIEFALPVFSVYENGTNAIIVVTRSGNLSDAVTVDYATTNGSAQDVQDYIGVSGTLRFASNEVVKTFNIPLVDNALPESDETFFVTLSNPSGAVLGAQSTTEIVIFDDDTEFFFSQTDYLV